MHGLVRRVAAQGLDIGQFDFDFLQPLLPGASQPGLVPEGQIVMIDVAGDIGRRCPGKMPTLQLRLGPIKQLGSLRNEEELHPDGGPELGRKEPSHAGENPDIDGDPLNFVIVEGCASADGDERLVASICQPLQPISDVQRRIARVGLAGMERLGMLARCSK